MSCTIKDIAKEAGVIHVTVSRILSNSNASHSPKTREKILKIAKRMNYQPNTIAKMMKGCQSKIIGIAARSNMEIGHYYLLDQCFREVSKNSYVPMMLDTRLLEDNKGMDMLNLVAGIICETSEQLSALSKLFGKNKLSKPVVMLRKVKNINSNVFNTHYDSATGMEMLMEHLTVKGHKKIIWAGPVEHGSIRKNSFRDYCEKHNVLTDYVDVKRGAKVNNNFLVGIEAAEKIYMKKSFTAVVACNDEIAQGVVCGLAQNGVKVPDDIAVAGFENMSFGAACNPPLTTVDLKPQYVAEKAVQLLIALIENSSELIRDKEYVIKPELIIRKSTGG